MKRIINGKRYNTETATLVADIGSDGHVSRTDFHWHDTYLYVTKSGNWFIAGKGGPLSRWAKSDGRGGSYGGSGICPMDQEEAREILEHHGKTKVLEDLFADEIVDA